MNTKLTVAVFVMALVLIVSQTMLCEAAPIGTAFTYQGYVYDANYPANNFYDFKFKLYDALTGGSQVGIDFDAPDVDVVDGAFTVGLDFGSSVFTGDARWLEIAIRPGDSVDRYTTLSPRQEITPTPYALYAQIAGNVGNDNDWMVSGNNMYSLPSGNVGIGTTLPTYKLDVLGDIRAAGSIYGTVENADMIDNYHYSTTWPTTLANIQNACSNNYHNIGGSDDDIPDNDSEVPDNITINNGILYAPSGGGNIGIGTTSPQSSVRLEVRGTGTGNAAIGGYSSGSDSIGIIGVGNSGGFAAIYGSVNGSDYAGYFAGNVYVTGNVSASSFTDRTPYPKDLSTAYQAVMSMDRLPNNRFDEYNKEMQLDHSKLSDFIRTEDGSRDLSATVSCLNEVVKDLIRQNQELGRQNIELNKRLSTFEQKLMERMLK